MGRDKGGGFVSCDAPCRLCYANPGCEKNIVHTETSDQYHRCRTCKRSWKS